MKNEVKRKTEIEQLELKAPTEKLVKNRLGEFEINLTKKIFFYNGLLGLPEYKNYCLTHVPKAEGSNFKLLQSADENEVSFIVLPIVKDAEGNYPLIENDDVKSITSELEVEEENIVLLLIVTFEQENEKSRIFVNARAPIIIDASKSAGLQYVFENNKYDVKHELAVKKL